MRSLPQVLHQHLLHQLFMQPQKAQAQQRPHSLDIAPTHDVTDLPMMQVHEQLPSVPQLQGQDQPPSLALAPTQGGPDLPNRQGHDQPASLPQLQGQDQQDEKQQLPVPETSEDQHQAPPTEGPALTVIIMQLFWDRSVF